MLLQSKLKAMAFQGSASVITEDMIKDQESVTTDTRQPGQPEEPPGAAGAEHMEKEDELPQQGDELSFSLDELNVTSSPESSTAGPNQDYNLVNSLLNLTKSPVSWVFFVFGVFFCWMWWNEIVGCCVKWAEGVNKHTVF